MSQSDVTDLLLLVRERDARIEYLEGLLRTIEDSVASECPELYPVGPWHTEFAADGNTVLRHVPPWSWMMGTGATFEEAVQDYAIRASLTGTEFAAHRERVDGFWKQKIEEYKQSRDAGTDK